VDLFCRTVVSGRAIKESNRQDSYPETTKLADVVKASVVGCGQKIGTDSDLGFYSNHH
jgi:hypothetical protein